LKAVIVDDEILERKALAKILAENMPDIQLAGEAANGRNAIRLADDLVPDIMLMDIKMPGIDGVEAVKEIRKRHPDIQFIMISAFDTFEYAKEVMRQGVKEYLLKPAKTEEIVSAIGRVQKDIRLEQKKAQEQMKLKEQLSKAISAIDLQSQGLSSEGWEGTSQLARTKEYIDSHYRNAITLEGAASYANLSPYHFSKIFKETFGITFIDYVTDLRIEQAKLEIRLMEKSLKEICFGVGYRDPNYFSRVFKKRTGFTPTEYRMMLNQGPPAK